MQTQPNICPQCHSPIPADAPGGLCPACVLLGVAGRTNPSQAAAASAPTMEEVAAAFPELEVLDILGQGGMGIVFKARQPRLDRFVALKVLPPALAAQPGFAERFTREARVLARLAHPNIVSIYDFGESAGFFYLIMEFVNGVNLRAAMQAGVKPEQALLLVPRICEALQFAHDHGVLHRDIKPENILLDTAGVPKLADFGIAKLAGEESGKTGLTATGAALGTAAYMAPEQVEKPATVDHRADIYSLGVVLYEMLTGELPLGRFAAPSEKSTVNRGVDDVVMRALEKERERRQQSATEMKTQVEGASHAGVQRVAAALVTPAEDPLLKRILLALCALSAVGIPLTGMMRWDVPNSRDMVFLTILFGTLAGLSKMFVSEIGKLAAPRSPTEPALPDPAGTGRKVALVGPGLLLGPMAGLVLSLPWLESVMSPQHHIVRFIIGIPFVLATIGGVGATLTALFAYRFRAPWFFWFVNFATVVAMYALDHHRFGFTALLGLGVIGYCIFYFREFFPARAASSATADALADPAPNPWPHRLFWLVVSMLTLPVVMVICAMLIPVLSRNSNGHEIFSVPFVVVTALLPFVAAVALYLGYRRTLPGAALATPRATWSPWPKRVFFVVLALIAVPLMLIGVGIAVPMLAYQGAAAPYRPAQSKPKPLRALPAAAVVTAERAPFIGKLSRGALELVSIAPSRSGQAGWRMDGAPATEGPFVNQEGTLTAQPGMRIYDFVFRSRDLPAAASLPVWQLAADWHSAGTSSPALAARPEAPLADYEVISAAYPESVHKADLQVGIATGSWVTLRDNPPGRPATSSFSHEGENWTVTQITATQAKYGETVVHYAFQPHENWQARVVAITTDGKEVAPQRTSIANDQAEWGFEDLPLEKVRQFRFQARRYGWVEFRGVALAPSNKGGNLLSNAALIKPEKAESQATPGLEPKAPIPAVPARPAPSPEVIRLQDEKIHIAREQFETIKKRVEAGVAPTIDQATAERDLALAEGRGNELLTASALVRYEEKRFQAARERANAGTGTTLEALAAEQELNTAYIRLEQARAEDESKRDPSLPPPLLVEDRKETIGRLRDEVIRLAREQLAIAKQRSEAGAAPWTEWALAERNMAVAEARGDELKIAMALVACAETQSKAMQESFQAGRSTPAEATAAEQELNNARIRLEEARAKAALAKDAADVEKPAKP